MRVKPHTILFLSALLSLPLSALAQNSGVTPTQNGSNATKMSPYNDPAYWLSQAIKDADDAPPDARNGQLGKVDALALVIAGYADSNRITEANSLLESDAFRQAIQQTPPMVAFIAIMNEFVYLEAPGDKKLKVLSKTLESTTAGLREAISRDPSAVFGNPQYGAVIVQMNQAYVHAFGNDIEGALRDLRAIKDGSAIVLLPQLSDLLFKAGKPEFSKRCRQELDLMLADRLKSTEAELRAEPRGGRTAKDFDENVQAKMEIQKYKDDCLRAKVDALVGLNDESELLLEPLTAWRIKQQKLHPGPAGYGLSEYEALTEDLEAHAALSLSYARLGLFRECSKNALQMDSIVTQNTTQKFAIIQAMASHSGGPEAALELIDKWKLTDSPENMLRLRMLLTVAVQFHRNSNQKRVDELWEKNKPVVSTLPDAPVAANPGQDLVSSNLVQIAGLLFECDLVGDAANFEAVVAKRFEKQFSQPPTQQALEIWQNNGFVRDFTARPAAQPATGRTTILQLDRQRIQAYVRLNDWQKVAELYNSSPKGNERSKLAVAIATQLASKERR